jgi:hypothetical protein
MGNRPAILAINYLRSSPKNTCDSRQKLPAILAKSATLGIGRGVQIVRRR